MARPVTPAGAADDASRGLVEAASPAPLWRRLAAGVYDAFLVAALWVAAAFVYVPLAAALKAPTGAAGMRALLFLLGFAFFGWFWTHGGQTLGMRAWRLRVRHTDGRPLAWRAAALRYAVAWLSFGVAGLGLLWCLVDARRRAWHDIAAHTELLVEPTPRL